MHNENRIKILQVNKLYHPWIGGVERIVQNIAEGLKNKVDMKVLVCRSRGSSMIEQVNDVEVMRASSLGVFFSMPVSLNFPYYLNKLSRDRDILLFHMPFPLADLSYQMSRIRGKNILVWWHSDIVKQKILLYFYRPFLLSFLRKTKKIFVATPRHIDSSNVLMNFRSRCEVIPFGIDVKKYEKNERVVEKVRGIRETYGPRIVLFVGRLIYYKGIEYLIQAMKTVEASLVVIGDGPLREELLSLTADVGVEQKVHFLGGGISDADMVAYYHACDVFVLPSVENSEAFGIVQMEAMACGKPVINTDLPTGVPYVSVDNETGYTVPIKDPEALSRAINAILINDELRQTFGANAIKRVNAEFTMDRMLDRILSACEEVALPKQHSESDWR
jgi:glycosyltransferase involved in cell wall biosynthesis